MKDEAARVERLQQHDTRGRPAGRVDGGERHRVRLGYGRSDRLVEPPRELVEGICRRVALVQGGTLVVDAQLRESGDG